LRLRYGLLFCIGNILNTSQQVGGAIGLAILSAVFASTFKSDLHDNASQITSKASAQLVQATAQVHGFHNGLQIGACLALGGSLVALLVIKNQKVKAEPGAAL
jgi:hypothetical protein